MTSASNRSIFVPRKTERLYGFDGITDLAGNLETGLNQQQALQDTTKQVNELIELIRRVEGYSHIAESNAIKS